MTLFLRRDIGLAVFGLTLCCSASFGWWDGGHMQVVLVGCEQMAPEDVLALAKVMNEHPYYARDFAEAMPEAVRGATELDRAKWVLAQASIWPDLVRDRRHPGHAEFSHGTWHYINQPIFLDATDAEWFAEELPANASMEMPHNESARERMNVVQAWKWLTTEATFDAVPQSEQAIRLCWILHLVGDIHQPLHSAALFSAEKLPEGDRGGNDTLVRGQRATNLHRLWDSAPGTADDYEAVLEAVAGYLNDPVMVETGEAAREGMEIERWLGESFSIARGEVYTIELLARMRLTEPDGSGAMGPYAIDSEYFETVERLSRVRVVEAGYRLSVVLTKFARQQKAGATEAAPAVSH